MPKPEIEEFAKLLVTLVRDRAIASCDGLLDSEARSVTARRWRERMNSGVPTDMAKEVIMDSIDAAIFHLLDAIDSGGLRLSFIASNGAVVNLLEDGMEELAGWYAGVDAWIAKYSQQRFVDDFRDLRLDEP